MTDLLLWPIDFCRYWYGGQAAPDLPYGRVFLAFVGCGLLAGIVIDTFHYHKGDQYWAGAAAVGLPFIAMLTFGVILLSLPIIAFTLWFGWPLGVAYWCFWRWCERHFRRQLDPDMLAAEREVERILGEGR